MTVGRARRLRQRNDRRGAQVVGTLRGSPAPRLQIPSAASIRAYVSTSSTRRQLIIEVDGGQHADRRTEDAVRTRGSKRRGVGVLRFWNNDVLGNLDGVLQTIRRHCGEPSPARCARDLSQGRG